MKSFLPKFLLCFFLFFILISYYFGHVLPSLSGDIGKIGQIPFGKDYESLAIDYYPRPLLDHASVKDVFTYDSLKYFSIITIGDSFSQCGIDGFQWKLSHLFNTPIANFIDQDPNPIQSFITAANSNCFDKDQIVIVECVERYLVERLLAIDLGISRNENSPLAPCKKTDFQKESLLYNFFSWIRLSFDFSNPVVKYKLNKVLFTHPKYSSTLFVYNSTKVNDGDLLWSKKNSDFRKASNSLIDLYNWSQEKGVQLVFLVAPDKYDAYEPWILENHPKNPTLSYFPDSSFLINPKSYIQSELAGGVKDFYKVNNTHWSVIGADLVADEVYKRIIENDWFMKR